jgi:glycosyltransferase involved in cell wall biosynthesis
MPNVLLTVSGTIAADLAEQVARGARPRADYIELARAFGADQIDYSEARRAGGWFGRLLERAGGAELTLAWACFKRRRQYQAIFSDGEQVGIPLAWFSKFLGFGTHRPRHLMIVHILSVKKKMLFFDRFGIQSHIDQFFVYSRWQKHFIENRWQIAAERVVFTPFMVDTAFFAPNQVVPNSAAQPMICSVGLEARDYPTLLTAVRGLGARVTIAAASPWSKRADSTQHQEIPENVTVGRFSQFELRQLYADCRFMVMPLANVDFQAGVTAILEAMAMGRAVICTKTPGQTDVVVEGETGLYVPPGDPQALRSAIEHLLANPREAERMGQAGRRLVEQSMSLDHYVQRLSRFVSNHTTSPSQNYRQELGAGEALPKTSATHRFRDRH